MFWTLMFLLFVFYMVLAALAPKDPEKKAKGKIARMGATGRAPTDPAH